MLQAAADASLYSYMSPCGGFCLKGEYSLNMYVRTYMNLVDMNIMDQHIRHKIKIAILLSFGPTRPTSLVGHWGNYESITKNV